VLLPAPAFAACTDGVFSFYLENDLFSNTDRNYTSGLKGTWISPNLADFDQPKCVPDWISWVEQRIRSGLELRFNTEATERNFVATLGQEIYTPRDPARSDPIPDDRPYAGWLYLGLGYNERRGQPTGRWGRLDSFELRLGVVGPLALGKQSQDVIHDIRGFSKFQGWHNQLKNEPGVQVIREVKHKYRFGGGDSADVIAHYGGSLGNIAIYANTGVEFRYGSRLPNDFGSSPMRPAGNNTSPGALGKGGWGQDFRAHVFAALDVRAVARDIFLDGNTFTDGPRIHRRPFVGDLAIGIAGYTQGWKLSYARVFRSREFDGQDRNHSYGAFTASTVF
jgi:hypothetical protein